MPSDVRTAYNDLIRYLYGRINYENAVQMPYQGELRLDRMRHLLEQIGNPQQQLRIIHVAGTKGKGSTCHLVSSVLMAAGQRVGLYTSPHLSRLEERFRLDGQPCAVEKFLRIMEPIRQVVDTMDQANWRPTFFEITTAAAFLLFADAQVDWAVMEVGLGGRLDSTNVCQPMVTAITSISYDHTAQLGNTLAKIATEKAGIIKTNIPVISGAGSDEAKDVIRKIAKSRSAPLIEWGTDFDVRIQGHDHGAFVFDYLRIDKTGQRHMKLANLALQLLGEHQVANAAMTLAILETLNLELPESHIRRGLNTATCPARIEVVSESPKILVDAAHNVASIAALLKTLAVIIPDDQPKTLILALTQGKDLEGMARLLIPRFDRIICTQYLNNPRAVPSQQLMDLMQRLTVDAGADTYIVHQPTPAAALDYARQPSSAAHQVLCATGSFFIAAEIRDILLGQG